jgi:flagellar hook-basal body complex protein FliE
MDKITAIGLHASQQAMLDKMHNMAAMAASGAVNQGQMIAPGASFPDVAGAGNLSFSQVLNNAIDNVDAVQHTAGASKKRLKWDRATIWLVR